jgi:Ca-activated chloride channel family protein
VKVSSFYTKIKDPALANTKLTFTGDIKGTKIYPSPLPDIFKGEQLIVVGRFTGKGDSAAVIEGTINGEPRKFSFDVKFTEETTEHEFIPRLWATRRVGYLLDEIRLRGENKELKDEVTELARKYGIVTPYTAYLILEDEQRRGVAQNVQTFRMLAEDRSARTESSQFLERASRERDGNFAVAGARAYQSMKSADSASEGIAGGAMNAFRAAPMAAPSLGRRMAGGGGRVVADVNELQQAAKEYTDQGRYINGRTFYQNGDQWVDGEVQKLTDAKRVKVQFGTPEYFELLKKYPRAAAWFALGAKLQLVLDGTVYEIYE